MAVDLLAQRPRRPRPAPARDAAPAESPRPGQGARPPRPRARQRRACSGSSGASSTGTSHGWTSPQIVGALRRRRPRCSPRSSPGSCARAEPMLPMRFFRNRAFSAANGASLFMYFGMFGSIFLLDPVLPDRARATRRSRPGSACCRGRRCRCSSRRSRARCPTASAAGRSWRPGSRCRRSGSPGSRRHRRRRRVLRRFVGPFIVSGIGMGMFFAPVANVVLSAVRRGRGGQGLGREQRDPRGRRRVRRRRPRLGLLALRRLRVARRPSSTGSSRRSGSARRSSASARSSRSSIPRKRGAQAEVGDGARTRPRRAARSRLGMRIDVGSRGPTSANSLGTVAA